ncbi:MAG: universal stress protein [Luteolibacter sp.]|jgi:nucleotide-binding universal stress UspA family protein
MKKILAAIDFSDATPGVLETAGQVAKAFGASLTVIHVVEPEPSYTAYGFTPDEFPAMHAFQQEARRRAQNRLDEVVGSLQPDVADAVGVIAEGSPLHCMLEHVEKSGVDLVIVGSHGHGALASILLGSVAEGMVRKAKVPTLVVPATAD